MSIPFTQYLRPNGRTRDVTIDMPEDIEKKAQELLATGHHFDIEELTTGMVSMTCEKGDDIISIQVCENGPPVEDAVKELIETAYQKR